MWGWPICEGALCTDIPKDFHLEEVEVQKVFGEFKKKILCDENFFCVGSKKKHFGGQKRNCW